MLGEHVGWEMALMSPLWKVVCDTHSTHLPSPFPGGEWPCLYQGKSSILSQAQLLKCPEVRPVWLSG